MDRATILLILDLARWAPSGDNSQPWTFRIVADDTVAIQVRDGADTDVYDFDARPTMLTIGFLLESMAIAASAHGAAVDWQHGPNGAHEHVLTVQFRPVGLPVDPLLAYLRTRSVVRGRYRRTPLSPEQKAQLAASLGQNLSVAWLETGAEKAAVARVNAHATRIRLRIPEAYTVHRRILDWHAGDSTDGVPAGAIGLDPLALLVMRWAMQKWERVRWMNRFGGGTALAELEMDLLPGKYCGAHFMVFGSAADADALIRTGRALQRYWLTATFLGLVLQPSLAPLCFAYYARHRRRFTEDPAMIAQAAVLQGALERLQSARSPDELLFMGRIGLPRGAAASVRSLRKPLSGLLR